MSSSEIKIAVCNSASFGRVFPEHMERLRSFGEVVEIDVPGDCHGKELAEHLDGVQYIITSGTPQFDAEFFSCKKDVKLVARDGLGFNNVDVRAANGIGAYVTKVEKPVEREAVAELTVGILMDLCRNIGVSSDAANEGRWGDRGTFIGSELRGLTVGIIGCGNIGSRVAEILGRGFGMRVLANDPVENRTWAQLANVEYVDLDTLIEQSDVVTVHATLNPTTYHLIDGELIERMKRGVYVINTARGDIVDQEGMVDALNAGQVRAYGTDALSIEPPDPDDPYLNNPRVLVTPHIGAYTLEALKGMGDKVVGDVELVISGKEPRNIVTIDMLTEGDGIHAESH